MLLLGRLLVSRLRGTGDSFGDYLCWITPILPKMVIALNLQLTDLESVHEEM